ncbi:lantibiotic dehydratase [Streptomyces flavidovirens]
MAEPIWQHEDFRSALKLATPVLSDAIEAVVRGRQAEPRHVRRTARSTVSYLLRWQHRPTPLGLFAGTAPVTVGPRASARWRDKHHAMIRPDAEWVTDIVLRLQRTPALLKMIPVRSWLECNSLLPAHAGMALARRASSIAQPPAPRACGDGPEPERALPPSHPTTPTVLPIGYLRPVEIAAREAGGRP